MDVDVIKLYNEKNAERKAAIEEELKSSSEFIKDAKPLLVNAGFGVKYVFENAEGETCVVAFTPEEIANL